MDKFGAKARRRIMEIEWGKVGEEACGASSECALRNYSSIVVN